MRIVQYPLLKDARGDGPETVVTTDPLLPAGLPLHLTPLLLRLRFGFADHCARLYLLTYLLTYKCVMRDRIYDRSAYVELHVSAGVCVCQCSHVSRSAPATTVIVLCGLGRTQLTQSVQVYTD